eukprot:EG_transcript_32699
MVPPVVRHPPLPPPLPVPAFSDEEEFAVRSTLSQPPVLPRLHATAASDGCSWFAGNYLYPNGWTHASVQRLVLLESPTKWWQFYADRGLRSVLALFGTVIVLIGLYLFYRVVWWLLAFILFVGQVLSLEP